MKYEKDLKEFRKTAEGKKYTRLKKSADQKRKVANAKKKFLLGDGAPKMPKRPMGAYCLFCNEKWPTLGGFPLKERSQKVTAMWNEIDSEEKKVWEEKAAADKEKYVKELAEYKANPLVKKYEKACKPNPKKKPAPRGGGRGGGKGQVFQAAGRGRGGRGRGRGAAAAAIKPDAASSDSDVMCSDSSDSGKDSDSD